MALEDWIGKASEIKKRKRPRKCFKCHNYLSKYNIGKQCFSHGVTKEEGGFEKIRAKLKEEKMNIPTRFSRNIIEKPLGIDARNDIQHYVDLAETIKSIESTKSIRLTVAEATTLFGKCFKSNILNRMKKLGIKHTRVVEKEGSVIIWANKV